MSNISTISLEQLDTTAVLTLTRPYSLNIAGKHELLETLRQLVEQAAFTSLFGTEDQRGRMSAYVKQRDAQKQ